MFSITSLRGRLLLRVIGQKRVLECDAIEVMESVLKGLVVEISRVWAQVRWYMEGELEGMDPMG